MVRRAFIGMAVSAALALSAAPGWAQTLAAGAGVQRDVQRFGDHPELARLDGAAGGWTLFGGAALASHIVLRVEAAFGGRMVDTDAFTIDIEGRPATIQSSLVHRTRSISGLAGYMHPLFARVRLTYLAGVSRVHVERSFTTNAASLVLVAPSFSNAVSTTLLDDTSTPIVGMDALVRIAPHIAAVAGVRVQPLDVGGASSGRSIRPLVGAMWLF